MNRRILAAPALAVAALAATIPSPASAQESHSRTEVVIASTAAEPIDIDATVYRPAGATATDPVPMVLHSHGWGGAKTNSETAFSDWLDAGYGVLSFSQRGFGASGGEANIEDPAHEGDDVVSVVDYVTTLDWVEKEADDPTDPVLFAIGGSYGGGYQFAGAYRELATTGSTRFDALAPEITWNDLSDSLAPQGVVRTTWVSLLYAAGFGSVPQEVHEAFVYGATTGQWPDGSVGGIEGTEGTVPFDIEGFFADNGPKFWQEQDLLLPIPVLFGQGTTDTLFPLSQGLANFDTILTPEARQASRFIGYNGGHALPGVFPVQTNGSGNPCSIDGNFATTSRVFFDGLRGLDSVAAELPNYGISTPQGQCIEADELVSVPTQLDTPVPAVISTVGVGAPQHIPLATGLTRIAGTNRLTAKLTTVGPDARAFFAISVGTSAADAAIIQNNVMPVQRTVPVVQEETTIELPAVAYELGEGERFFLTVTPISDISPGHGSRTPGAVVLEDVTVLLSVPAGDAPPPVVPEVPYPAVALALAAGVVLVLARRRRSAASLGA